MVVPLFFLYWAVIRRCSKLHKQWRRD